MNLPVRAFIVLAFLLCVACLTAHAQAKSDNNASVSGKVTLKGKPAAAIVVGMRASRPEQSSSTYKAKTDQEGVYRITKVPAGSYVVAPVAPAFVVSDLRNQQGQSVIISENENVDAINFDLIPGGVITGKVTDSEGHPIVEERVSIIPADNSDQRPVFNNGMSTDDRGVYRIFGLPAGHYKVSVGDPRFSRGPRRQVPAQTFYPNVTDATKAEIVEVSEGSEATKIDIAVGEARPGYSVTGRVIDADSGAPVAGAVMQLTRIQVIDANNSSASGEYVDARSDAQGQFRLTNIQPGKYEVNFYPPDNSDLRADAPASFDIVDQDVSGLVIKAAHGSTIAGTVVVEGSNSKPSYQASQIWVMLQLRADGNPVRSYGRSYRVNPDGSFFIGGLSAGTANLSVAASNSRGISTTRVELNGVVQSNGIQIQNGQHIEGVRLVTSFGNASIRGVVQLANGTLSPTAHLFVQVMKVGDQALLGRGGVEADARGHFLIEGLTAGDYELRVMAYSPDSRSRPPMSVKQVVTVNEGATTDVNLTLDLTPSPNE